MTSEPTNGPDAAHVVVLGLMASGKSTVGTALARRLGRPLVDNDTELGRVAGTTAAAYAAERGIDALHDLELEVLRTALARPAPAVVTAAASVGDRAELAELVAAHHVVWLDVDPSVLADRVRPHGDHRPLPVDALAQLRSHRERRLPNFRAAADVVVSWRDEEPSQVVDRILAELGLDEA